MRRGGTPTALTDHGADVWLVERPHIHAFPIAEALARTSSLTDAQAIVGDVAQDEIAYERAKAAAGSPRDKPADVVIADALKMGATHITGRRLLEAADIGADDEEEFVHDLERAAARIRGLWELETLPVTLRPPAGDL